MLPVCCLMGLICVFIVSKSLNKSSCCWCPAHMWLVVCQALCVHMGAAGFCSLVVCAHVLTRVWFALNHQVSRVWFWLELCTCVDQGPVLGSDPGCMAQ
jgi:hypothetical protein